MSPAHILLFSFVISGADLSPDMKILWSSIDLIYISFMFPFKFLVLLSTWASPCSPSTSLSSSGSLTGIWGFIGTSSGHSESDVLCNSGWSRNSSCLWPRKRILSRRFLMVDAMVPASTWTWPVAELQGQQKNWETSHRTSKNTQILINCVKENPRQPVH